MFWIPAFSADLGEIPQGPSGVASPMEQGLRSLAGNHPDSARFYFLEANRLGFPRDSLFFLLAETALQSSAFDTALVFNFAIPTDRSGVFRKSVVEQRLRIYSGAGMKTDFERLRDSVAFKSGIRREKKWTLDWRLISGYGLENYFPTRQYPFSENLGGLETGGWLAKTHAGISRSLSTSVPIRLGIGCDAGKAYYKDSMDVGFSALGRVGKAERGPSLGLVFALGRVTGVGNTGSGRADAEYLWPHRHGLAMIQAGFEGEWKVGDSRRYDLFWISTYADQKLPFGKVSLGFTLSQLRQDPLLQENSMPVIYVDDVTKPMPIHYRNQSFQAVLMDSTAAATYALYTSMVINQNVSMVAPQNVRVFAPTLEYSFPLPFGFSGEAGGRTEFLIYPEPYTWEEAALPVAFQSGDFQALAMSKVDRKYYSAVLRLQNGVLTEFYSGQPMVQRKATREDWQWRAQASLGRAISNWGRLNLSGYFGDTRSSLSNSAPVWIPSWESGVTLSWTSQW